MTKRHNRVLALDYDLFGQAPVQALGRIRGRELYFRARHDDWEFEVANENGELPSETNDPSGFVRRGKISDAGFLSEEQAIDLIEKCAADFARTVDAPR